MLKVIGYQIRGAKNNLKKIDLQLVDEIRKNYTDGLSDYYSYKWIKLDNLSVIMWIVCTNKNYMDANATLLA
jgi:hypothetical protein